MTNDMPDQSEADLRREALHRFVAATSERAGAKERRALEEWTGQDSDRRREIARLERIATDVRLLAADFPVPGDRRAPSPWRGVRWMTAGAAVCAVCAALVMALPPRVVSAEGGRTHRLELATGITVHLDAGSVVEVPRQPWDGSIRLVRGRAVFDVVHDDRRQFTVRTAAASIVDVGTRFLVRDDAQGVAVAVFEGEVLVSTPQGGAERVAARRALAVSPGGEVRSMPLPDEDSETAWRQGRVVFKNNTLAEVAESLSRYSQRPVVIGSSAIAGLRVSGTFALGATADAVRALEQVLPVRAVERPEATVLEPRSGASTPVRLRR